MAFWLLAAGAIASTGYLVNNGASTATIRAVDGFSGAVEIGTWNVGGGGSSVFIEIAEDGMGYFVGGYSAVRFNIVETGEVIGEWYPGAFEQMLPFSYTYVEPPPPPPSLTAEQLRWLAVQQLGCLLVGSLVGLAFLWRAEF